MSEGAEAEGCAGTDGLALTLELSLIDVGQSARRSDPTREPSWQEE